MAQDNDISTIDARQNRDFKYTQQTTESYAAIGKFVCEFELLCEQMRLSIWICLSFYGLKNTSISLIILTDLTAQPLLTLLERLHAETFQQFDELALEKRISDQILNEIKELIQKRNSIVHGTYRIGWASESQTDFSNIQGYKLKANKSKGHHIETLPESKDEYDTLSKKLNNSRNLLSRLTHYIHPLSGKRDDIKEDSTFQEQGYLP